MFDIFDIEMPSQHDKRLYPEQNIIEEGRVIRSETWVYAQADANSARITQYTYGEPLGVMAAENEFLYVQSLRDGYCGWIKKSAFQKQINMSATHMTRFNAPIIIEADLKSKCLHILPRDCLFTPDDEQGDYWHIPDLGWAHRRHISECTYQQPPLETAQELLGQSYVWGGRGVAGLDCSALVQLCYRWAGMHIPRDADLQACYLQTHHQLVKDNEWQVGDLLFVPGHVMLMSGDDEIIHASGHDMRVVREPLSQALKRYQHSLQERYILNTYRW